MGEKYAELAKQIQLDRIAQMREVKGCKIGGACLTDTVVEDTLEEEGQGVSNRHGLPYRYNWTGQRQGEKQAEVLAPEW